MYAVYQYSPNLLHTSTQCFNICITMLTNNHRKISYKILMLRRICSFVAVPFLLMHPVVYVACIHCEHVQLTLGDDGLVIIISDVPSVGIWNWPPEERSIKLPAVGQQSHAKLAARKCGNCEALQLEAAWLNASQSLSAFTKTPTPSLKLVSLSIPVLQRF